VSRLGMGAPWKVTEPVNGSIFVKQLVSGCVVPIDYAPELV
jgi:hypothetical protein